MTTKPIAVTLAEATKLSGLGRTSLYKLFADGSLSPRKFGKRTLVMVNELEAVLQSLPTSAPRAQTKP